MERYRIHPDAALYFCTFSIVDWLPVFVSERPCQIVADSLRFCHEQKQLGIDAFVLMPTHLHLIVFDRDWNTLRLQQTLAEFRKFTGRQLADFCATGMPAFFSASLSAAAGDDRKRRFWQDTRHPEAITGENFHRQKRDYVHDNPRRKGLVMHPSFWRWSSARWYERQENCGISITTVAW
jgi:REP element-mobilizing transposase RayT